MRPKIKIWARPPVASCYEILPEDELKPADLIRLMMIGIDHYIRALQYVVFPPTTFRSKTYETTVRPSSPGRTGGSVDSNVADSFI